MQARLLLTRAAIDLCIILTVMSLFVSYFWFKSWQIRTRLAKESEVFIREEVTMQRGLESLGVINLQPNELTRAKLEEQLHQRGRVHPAFRNSNELGWFCGKDRCGLSAEFLNTSSQEVPQSAASVAIGLIGPISGPIPKFAIGGAFSGRVCRGDKRPLQETRVWARKGARPIMWDKDWMLVWGDLDGKVDLLLFRNEKLLEDGQPEVTPHTHATTP